LQNAPVQAGTDARGALHRKQGPPTGWANRQHEMSGHAGTSERIVIMANAVVASTPGTRGGLETRAPSASYQAYQLLHWGFVIVPVIAGVDKFLHLLTNWDRFLSPTFARISPLSVHTTMQAVGVVEIVAGLVVAVKPRFGAYLVALWLAGIIVNGFLLGSFFDIWLRDFGLFLGALALGRLSAVYDVAQSPSAVALGTPGREAQVGAR
jgi:hypothetical protein